mmetsp:Transcript_14893/g.27528  ORF Transcript_14893/g.27528 Transcript_14893/m.27528 type:complete len:285 (-) Transcript_14893:74-928(-)|eukprot:CAMPEP_0204909740 /NCGR_PEP_ID=MMETSP1397-20131031/8393_1 /ASSEMBLY_ACC=CAM_ASM_000891 /TAXON_ID=49980 /ORGANISM="Climacostomum Climacostomum virens, Strain Stock W-24" /LENGTH=284 /DNA_ID=CAMNT_0052079659 /DNA_START=1557 /DNA_END=2411 /DNA_ORIENTATION=-
MQAELSESPDLKSSFYAENLAEVVPMLKERQTKCIEEGNLMEAEAIKLKILSIQKRQKELEDEELLSKQKADKESVEAAHLERFNAFNAEWDEKLASYTADVESQLKQLSAKHAADRQAALEELEKSIPKTPKSSSKLLDLLRKKEVHIRAEEFKEAYQLQLEHEDLERRELEKWEREREESIAKHMKKFDDKLSTELNGLKRKFKAGYDEMKSERASKMETLIKRYQNDIKQLESAQKIEKNKRDGKHTTSAGRSSMQVASISRILASSRAGTPANSFRAGTR